MPPASESFTPLNIADDVVPEWLGSFTLAAPPNTDLWRKLPAGDTSTAPILYTALRSPFIAAEVTVSADWELEWDQGGLVIFAGAPPGQIAAVAAAATATLELPDIANIVLDDSATPSPSTSLLQSPSIDSIESFDTTSTQTPAQESGSSPQIPRGPPPAYAPPAPASKWVKVGLEFCNNAFHATSVVANCEGADWSLSALPAHHARRLDLRVKIERIGYALWVWYEDGMMGWKKLREVTSFFWGVEDKAIRVGVYASRPASFGMSSYDRRQGGGQNTGMRNLVVEFEGLEIF
jgi:regulation of enolase protein 1 (concanavalin A-like superfamily)